MKRLDWRKLRNLSMLVGMVGLSILALARALWQPVHWLWALPVLFVTWLLWNVYAFAHPGRRVYWPSATPEYASATHEKVVFKSRDGLDLFGWYLPGKNRAALVLVHGLGSAGLDMVAHARPFVEAGYGVFLIDLRAHGSSDGGTSTHGLLEGNDVAGAVDYLLTRQDVAADKIGALGISLGAQAVLRGALQTGALRAIVMEGLGPAVLEDHGDRRTSLWRWTTYPVNWLGYKLSAVLVGGKNTPVREAISGIAPRPLILIACGNREIYFNRMFYAAARDPRELWELPNARHAAALAAAPEEYRQRVIKFFDESLEPDRPPMAEE